MEKVFIMTWNTALYTEKSSTPISEKYKSVVNVVKGFLEKRNSICFLQEIPYVSNENWKEHILYSELGKDFPAEEYDIVYNGSSKNQIMMSIAIAKKGIITKSDNNQFNTNRAVTIQYRNTDLKITGIHASNGNDNENYLTSLNSCQSSIILGDFNAGNYQESENREVFNSILKNYKCICNKGTRRCKNRVTPIDHIFLNTNDVSKHSEPIIHEEIECSDHYPITFNIELGPR